MKRFFFSSNSGLTFLEFIIATAIFSIAAVIAARSFVLISASTNKAVLSQQLYDDSRYVMERLVKIVREGTIDYEEYWNASIETPVGSDPVYGANYGNYAKQFIDPGIDPDTGVTDEFGTECVSQDTGLSSSGVEQLPPCPPGERVAGSTIDENIGRNPHDSDATFANAVCQGGASCANASHRRDELYIINGNGTKKTIIKRIANNIDDDRDGSTDEGDATDTAQEFIGLLQMNGSDTTTSTGKPGIDGVIDTWSNDPDFADFVSITPPNIEIIDLDFYIAPLEDPFKAFDEDTSDIQMQPHVTIVMTARIAQSETIGMTGIAPEITLQTTVTSRVLSGIRTF